MICPIGGESSPIIAWIVEYQVLRNQVIQINFQELGRVCIMCSLISQKSETATFAKGLGLRGCFAEKRTTSHILRVKIFR